MTEQREGTGETAQGNQGDAPEEQPVEEQGELEAEQESAAAMDAEVPQPPGADQTTEGQPS
ncbi:MAG TPA: hypothetical protein VF553_14275 [Pyrinomonadaceae bacterium]